ncbi:MAG TPA: hypothetical protein ENN22_14735 [bacterium]|nr:hypothetical protein [bacterium]
MKKIFYAITLLIVIIVIIGVITMKKPQTDLLYRAPQKINGWEIAETDKYYTADNLYDYINGGAELFLSYGFQTAMCRTYVADGQPEIILDIFDMGKSQNAFGVFSHALETVDDRFGQGSQYMPGLLQFWKGRYYVSILASPETETARAAMFLLAEKLERVIEKTGPLPRLIEALPQDSLIQSSVRYFRHYIWLNSHYYLSAENILNIDHDAEAVLAKYRMDSKQPVVLVVKYQNDKKASAAMQKFIAEFLDGQSDPPVLEKEQGKWLGYRVYGNYFIAVFESPNARIVESLLKSMEDKI